MNFGGHGTVIFEIWGSKGVGPTEYFDTDLVDRVLIRPCKRTGAAAVSGASGGFG
jgi:hypothetical protein